ncbi:hypothetical protein BJV74DRAFT_568726 [Russula compacta]|nr:hypothetical protein BJV74DRAFT_568726 [Russula compacta]
MTRVQHLGLVHLDLCTIPWYPRWMMRRPLVIATSALSSLQDAMFGYSQGIAATNQVQPSFIERMFDKDVTMKQIQMNTALQPLRGWCLIPALYNRNVFNDN